MVSSVIRKSQREQKESDKMIEEYKKEEEYITEDKSEYRDFFPVQITFVRGIQLVPEDFTIFGVAVNMITGYNTKIYGIQTGLICENSKLSGIQAGLICSSEYKMIGFQTGLINSAYYIAGFQIGLLNTVKQGSIRFMSIINIGF